MGDISHKLCPYFEQKSSSVFVLPLELLLATDYKQVMRIHQLFTCTYMKSNLGQVSNYWKIFLNDYIEGLFQGREQ